MRHVYIFIDFSLRQGRRGKGGQEGKRHPVTDSFEIVDCCLTVQ